MDKLTAIKIKYDDGTYSDEIPVSALAENVEWDSTHTLVDILGSIDVDVTGTIQDQISQLFNEKVSSSQLSSYVNSQLKTDVTTWLNDNVDPVGSAVIVDSSLSIEGAAADAQKVGQLKSAFVGAIGTSMNDDENYYYETIIPEEELVETKKSDTTFWITNREFTPGYIVDISIQVNSTDQESCLVGIYYKTDDNTIQCQFVSDTVEGNGIVTIPVNFLAVQPFYVGIKAHNGLYDINTDYNGILWARSTTPAVGAYVTLTDTNKPYFHHYYIKKLNIPSLLSEYYTDKSRVVTFFDASLNSTWLTNNPQYTTILDLPINKIYKCDIMDKDEATNFGLPTIGHGTLAKFSVRQASIPGYNLYFYTTGENKSLSYIQLYWTLDY